MTGDKKLMEVYQSHGDAHTETTMFLGGGLSFDEAKANKQLRSIAKNVNFLMVYGGGPSKLVRTARKAGIDLSLEQAKEYMLMFFESYPEAGKRLKVWAAQAEASQKSFTHMGKIRALDPKRCYTQGMNNPIQGTAAEIQLVSSNLMTYNLQQGLIDCLPTCHLYTSPSPRDS